MKTLREVTVGDQLVMIYRTGVLHSGKSTDRIVPAIVTEAKRINLTVGQLATEGLQRRWWAVRRDTRAEGGASGSYGWRAYTLDEHEHAQRLSAATSYLTQQGLMIRLGSAWRGREIELAALIRTHMEATSE